MSFFGRPAEPKDIEVTNLPSDSTSQLAFSPTADLLAVASWNNEVRLYEVSPQGQAVGKASYSHEGPALSVQWSKVRKLLLPLLERWFVDPPPCFDSQILVFALPLRMEQNVFLEVQTRQRG